MASKAEQKKYIRDAQRGIREFSRRMGLNFADNLKADGDKGSNTERAIERAKWFQGEGKDRINAVIDREFLWRLEHPNKVIKPGNKDFGFAVSKETVDRGERRREDRRQAIDDRIQRQKDRADDDQWGGCRGVTDFAIEIVNNRALVTSRKRAPNDPLSIQNPDSDHSGRNTNADAVDFGIAEAHGLADEIARKLGGPSDISDYQMFYITFRGRRFRIQIIAGTHGTGPHLHVGVAAA